MKSASVTDVSITDVSVTDASTADASTTDRFAVRGAQTPKPLTGLEQAGFAPGRFRDGWIDTTGGCLHYVRGGEPGNPVVVLVPGWPQTWYAWRRMMPELARSYDVIAFDLPGLGASGFPPQASMGSTSGGSGQGSGGQGSGGQGSGGQGYSTRIASDAIATAMRSLEVDSYHVIAHDIGSWVAYTHGLDHPGAVRSLVLMDAALPGLNLESGFSLENAPRLFQFFFNAVETLPENLTKGRVREFLDFFFTSKSVNTSAIGANSRELYSQTYREPGRMAAGFGYYRAVPRDAAHVSGRTLAVPVLALGAETGVKSGLVEALRRGPAPTARGGEVAGCGHYMPEECPEELLGRVASFHRDLQELRDRIAQRGPFVASVGYARARSGDADAFGEQLRAMTRELGQRDGAQCILALREKRSDGAARSENASNGFALAEVWRTEAAFADSQATFERIARGARDRLDYPLIRRVANPSYDPNPAVRIQGVAEGDTVALAHFDIRPGHETEGFQKIVEHERLNRDRWRSWVWPERALPNHLSVVRVSNAPSATPRGVADPSRLDSSVASDIAEIVGSPIDTRVFSVMALSGCR